MPRGRHAPPLEIRQEAQRRRLYQAAAAVFSRTGYAEATAEAIAREAGMSKATFYEHFDNKEDCIVALFDAATDVLLSAMKEAASAGDPDPRARYRASIVALLEVIDASPDAAQTLLVQIIGAGPRAMRRRDRVMAQFARYIDDRNRDDAAAGLVPRLASYDDAYAIVGAVVELASRQLRAGAPQGIRELEPVVERLINGMLAAADAEPATR